MAVGNHQESRLAICRPPICVTAIGREI